MLSFRPLPVLSIVCLVSLSILLWLGAWQWSRYEEKLSRATAPVERLVVGAAPDLGRAVFVYAVLEGRPGWRIFAPVRTARGGILVDVGFSPGLEPPTDLSPYAQRSVSGLWTAPRRANPFVAKPDLVQRRFYAIELADMAQSVGVELGEIGYLAADYGSRPNPFAAPEDALQPERHLGYALTWWGLAVGLVAVYVALHASRGRLSYR